MIEYFPKPRVYHPQIPSVDAVSTIKKFMYEASSVDFSLRSTNKKCVNNRNQKNEQQTT